MSTNSTTILLYPPISSYMEGKQSPVSTKSPIVVEGTSSCPIPSLYCYNFVTSSGWRYWWISFGVSILCEFYLCVMLLLCRSGHLRDKFNKIPLFPDLHKLPILRLPCVWSYNIQTNKYCLIVLKKVFKTNFTYEFVVNYVLDNVL